MQDHDQGPNWAIKAVGGEKFATNGDALQKNILHQCLAPASDFKPPQHLGDKESPERTVVFREISSLLFTQGHVFCGQRRL